MKLTPLSPIPGKKRKMQVVIDTNVIVSAFFNSEGMPAKVISLILAERLKINYDNSILFEYIDVLSREEFCFTPEIINKTINHIKNNGIYVSPQHSNVKFTDESDKKFYEVYKSGNADYLITGNIRHFPKEAKIVQPKKFLDTYFSVNEG
jgi:putative PIN family toxin of toxin-antitoxin system